MAKVLCPIPFLQLQLNALGKVSACCFSREHEVGDATQEGILEIWNGSEMRKWRREFLDNDIQICRQAMQEFSCHKLFRHLNDQAVYEEFQTEPPKRLDLRLNGRCNLECRMCDIWRHPNGLYEQSDFWQIGPTQIFPYLTEIEMLGGEPLIQRDTFRLIDEVLKVNKNCSWGFVTNGQYDFARVAARYLDRIRIHNIQLSIDAVDKETYEKIRLKGSWSRLLKSLEQIKEFQQRRCDGPHLMSVHASMCVQEDNQHQVEDFKSFCQSYDLVPILQNRV